MQRIICQFNDLFVSFGTHHHIGGLDTDHQIVIAKILDDPHFIQSTLHKPVRCDTMVFFYQFFFQRTAVYAYSNRNISLLCAVYHSCDPLLAADISRIDADLICAVFHGGDSQCIIKVNIRHQRNVDLFLDLL